MLREFLNHWNPRLSPVDDAAQSAALPYSVVDGKIAFLLVTSRRSGRWIFPKGSVGSGLSAWDSAAREALEEAGVLGTVEQTPIGSYRASTGSNNERLTDVALYPFQVTDQLDEWKEKTQRLRHWVILPEAKRLLADPLMAKLAVRLHDRLLAELTAGAN